MKNKPEDTVPDEGDLEPSAMESDFDSEEPAEVEPLRLTVEQIESRQRAHESKVRKFFAGGEF